MELLPTFNHTFDVLLSSLADKIIVRDSRRVCDDKKYFREELEQDILVWNILFAENLTACIINGPNIRNPIGNSNDLKISK